MFLLANNIAWCVRDTMPKPIVACPIYYNRTTILLIQQILSLLHTSGYSMASIGLAIIEGFYYEYRPSKRGGVGTYS